jgi:bifunctional DNA-binding transcriptional regulator/antitoxin component of YhaV-PrlF toxin-antitoxin module
MHASRLRKDENMNKIYKILGKRGRITVPYEIRLSQGFEHNDVISFEEKDNCVIIKREKICDSCKTAVPKKEDKKSDEITLLEFLDGLSEEEQRAALIHLSLIWARNGGKKIV